MRGRLSFHAQYLFLKTNIRTSPTHRKQKQSKKADQKLEYFSIKVVAIPDKEATLMNLN